MLKDISHNEKNKYFSNAILRNSTLCRIKIPDHFFSKKRECASAGLKTKSHKCALTLLL